MCKEDALDRTRLARFQAGQRRGGPRYTTVASLVIVLEWYSAREGALMPVDEKGIQKTSMHCAVFTELKCVLVCKCPYD